MGIFVTSATLSKKYSYSKLDTEVNLIFLMDGFQDTDLETIIDLLTHLIDQPEILNSFYVLRCLLENPHDDEIYRVAQEIVSKKGPDKDFDTLKYKLLEWSSQSVKKGSRFKPSEGHDKPQQ